MIGTCLPNDIYSAELLRKHGLKSPDKENSTDLTLTIYGFMFFSSILISPLPGYLFKLLQKKTGSELKANAYGLTTLLTFTVVLGSIMSFQMCIKDSLVNAIALVIEFSFFRTFFFIVRSLFLYLYLPQEQFGYLFGLALIPVSLCGAAISPIYSNFILGSSIDGGYGEADFVPVSASFGFICIGCSYMVIYNIFHGKRLVRTEKNKNITSRDETTKL